MDNQNDSDFTFKLEGAYQNLCEAIYRRSGYDPESVNSSEAEFRKAYLELIETIDGYSEYEGDNGKYKLYGKAYELASWYNNTQSLVKLLYELEAAGKLTEKQKRTYHRKRKEFGWDKVKSEKDIIDKNLKSNSPYTQLVQLFERDCMAYRREQKDFERISDYLLGEQEKEAREFYEKHGKEQFERLNQKIKDLANVMDWLRDVESGGSIRTFIDEDSGVSALYKESEEVEAQALQDIQDIRVLSERVNNLLSEVETNLGNAPAMKRLKVSLENEVIYKAIQIGYTAGLNANTTEMLRKMKADNGSCNSN